MNKLKHQVDLQVGDDADVWFLQENEYTLNEYTLNGYKNFRIFLIYVWFGSNIPMGSTYPKIYPWLKYLRTKKTYTKIVLPSQGYG